MTVERHDAVELYDSFEPLRSAWSDLARRSGNVFATPELAETWWRHFGGGRRLAVAAARRDGEVAALVPLYVWRERPLRIVRLVGHRVADELGPLAAPEDRPLAAELVREALARLRADALVAEQLPRDAGWRGLLGARELSREGNPVLRFDGRGWDDVVRAWSGNLRSKVKRTERKLERDHDSSYRLSDEPSRLDDDLATLFRLHRMRWSGHASAFAAREAFHRDFAPLALERGWLRLWLLELDGAPAAAWYGFRFGDAVSYYQLGRDPSHDALSVGFALLVHTMRAALEEGATEYRFLRGDEPYKYRFATADEGLETLGLPCGALGGAALAGAAAARAARRAYRARRS